jgi:hypothetical protein
MAGNGGVGNLKARRLPAVLSAIVLTAAEARAARRRVSNHDQIPLRLRPAIALPSEPDLWFLDVFSGMEMVRSSNRSQ